MVVLDLDVINKKVETVKLFGKEVEFKTNSLRSHFRNESLMKEIASLPGNTEEELILLSEKVTEYLMGILDITKEEAEMVSMEQFKAISDYMARKQLYEQGFSDKEIDKMEKDMLKKKIAALDI